MLAPPPRTEAAGVEAALLKQLVVAKRAERRINRRDTMVEYLKRELGILVWDCMWCSSCISEANIVIVVW